MSPIFLTSYEKPIDFPPTPSPETFIGPVDMRSGRAVFANRLIFPGLPLEILFEKLVSTILCCARLVFTNKKKLPNTLSFNVPVIRPL